MKKLITSIAALCCVLHLTHGQVSFGLRLGASPSVTPGTAPLFVNREDPANECLFNVHHVDFTGQVGWMVRTETQNFWFMGEMMYGQSTTHYSLNHTYRFAVDETTDQYKMQKSTLEIPLTAGVKLGLLEIFSGILFARDLGINTDLNQVAGYHDIPPSWRFGWHAGAGVNLGMVLIDLRYQQQFNNYGSGQFIYDQELCLKDVPGRLTATVGIRIR